MTPIIPAIIPTSAEHVLAEAARFGFSPRVQIDIVDGQFAKPASWPYTDGGFVADAAREVCAQYEVQVDIMALNPETAITQWAQAGAREVVVHLESVATPDGVIALCNRYNLKLWLSGNDDLPVERYLQYQDDIHGVQLMGIHTIGQQGQPLSARVIENITALRAAAPTLPILIDGSVNPETIIDLHAAGASAFVVGSALTQAPDPRATYRALCQQVN